MPENFSIIDHPVDVLTSLGEFNKVFSKPTIKKIKVSHKGVRTHDLGAEILLARIGRVSQDYLRDKKGNKKNGVTLQGQYSNDDQINKLLRAVGIVKELEIQGHQIGEQDEKIVLFKKESILNEDVKIGSIDQETRATVGFVDYLNNCLKESGNKLIPDAQQKVAEYTGEIITNAKECIFCPSVNTDSGRS